MPGREHAVHLSEHMAPYGASSVTPSMSIELTTSTMPGHAAADHQAEKDVVVPDDPGVAVEQDATTDRQANHQRVKEHERRCGDRDRPREPVAEVGAQDRVGGDARGVVVGKAGEHARSDYGERGRQRRAPAASVAHEASRDASPLVPDLGFTSTHDATAALRLAVVLADHLVRRI
jgi:hypothetical protein